MPWPLLTVTLTFPLQNTDSSKTLTHLNSRASGGKSSHKILSLKNVAHMTGWYLLVFLSLLLARCPRDDNFSDTLSQKADSEASSGHTGEDRCSGKDMASPTDTRVSEAYITRLVWPGGVQVRCDHEIIAFPQSRVMSVTLNMIEVSSDWTDLDRNETGNIRLCATFYKSLFLFFLLIPAWFNTFAPSEKEVSLDYICIFRDQSLAQPWKKQCNFTWQISHD